MDNLVSSLVRPYAAACLCESLRGTLPTLGRVAAKSAVPNEMRWVDSCVLIEAISVGDASLRILADALTDALTSTGASSGAA